MIVGGAKVNFDRILRVTLWSGGTATGKGPSSVVLEYAPLADIPYKDKNGKEKTVSGAALCPNIDVEINDITNPNRKNNKPGFTATVTITNPAPIVQQIIAANNTWVLDFVEKDGGKDNFVKDLRSTTQDSVNRSRKVLENYMNSRVRIRIEAGYWRSENTDKVAERRDYSTIFEGHVNSSAWYRKGIDDKMVLMCHNFDMSEMSTSAVVQSLGIRNSVKDNTRLFLSMAENEKKKRCGYDARNWVQMAMKLIRLFQMHVPASMERPNGNETNYTPVIPASWRNKTDWYDIRFIWSPTEKKYWNTNRLRAENLQLHEKALKTDTKNFYTVAQYIDNMLADLCSWGGLNVDFEIDLKSVKDKVIMWVYPRGAGIKFTRADRADIQIVDYHTLLEAPSAAASGALTIKMFFNPDCEPQKTISLILTDEKKATVSFSASSGAYSALIQGPYSQAVRSLEKTLHSEETVKDRANRRGYLYNVGFPILKAKHKLSTRGNDWYTEVQTIPMTGGLLE